MKRWVGHGPPFIASLVPLAIVCSKIIKLLDLLTTDTLVSKFLTVIARSFLVLRNTEQAQTKH